VLHFVDASDLRIAELRRIRPELAFEPAHLPVGFATAAPDPQRRAHDRIAAYEHAGPCFAEAVDLVTLDGQSLRLELDSENDARFCRWRRETPARYLLSLAVRLELGAPIRLFSAECEGRIADQPAGPRALGWDRLFVPDGFTRTLAELTAEALERGGDPDPVGVRSLVYEDLAACLAGGGAPAR
jgi:hypothetical protein